MKIVLGDITDFKGDAIINAANTQLFPGAGVDGAIRKAAGSDLDKTLERRTLLPVAGIQITKGFNLSPIIVHTVAPFFNDDVREWQLTDCYRHACEEAWKFGCNSIAFPLLGTGAFGWPMQQGAKIAIEALKQWEDHMEITLYAYDQGAYDILNNLL